MIKQILLVLTVSFLAYKSVAQVVYNLNKKDIYGEYPSDLFNNPPPVTNCPNCIAIIAFPADEEVKRIFGELISFSNILPFSSFIKTIHLRQSPIHNFISTNTKDSNFIFYDREFYNQFRDIPNVDIDYLIRFSLAHELGHFINHDIEKQLRSKELEKNADMFACGLLINMPNVSKDKIKNSIFALTGAAQDSLYPNKGDRIKFVDTFFSQNASKIIDNSKFTFSDDFVDNSASWPKNSTINTTVTGKIKLKKCEDNIDLKRDFQVSVNTKWLSGSNHGFGIVFCSKADYSSHFAFMIQHDGNYIIENSKTINQSDAIKLGKSEFINLGSETNKLDIKNHNNTLTFFINNSKVYECPFKAYGTCFGLEAGQNGGPQNIEFSEFSFEGYKKK